MAHGDWTTPDAGGIEDDPSFLFERFEQTGGYLFHYTSVEGLLGVVNSKSLWASHAFYMNDPMELQHAYSVLAEVVDSLHTSAESSERRHILGHLAKWIPRLQCPLPVFVFSLTKPGDSLNHWRLYTPKRRGVAIGFPVEVLKEAAEQSAFHLVRCVYEKDHQIECLREAVESIVNTADIPEAMRATQADPRCLPYHDHFDGHASPLVVAMASIKVDHFADEREWRLVSSCESVHWMPNAVRFRPGASLLLPYVEISLSESLARHPGSLILVSDPEIGDLDRHALFEFGTRSDLIHMVVGSSIPMRRY